MILTLRSILLSMDLFTIGYEGLSISHFWNLLVTHEIEMLLDVRSTPWSRKPGFSKSALERTAEANNIRYQHWGKMGCPRDILQAYRQDANWEVYSEKFWKYLRTQDEDVIALSKLAQSLRCCLLCFEADPNYCHRSYVAEYAQEFAPTVRIVHLNTLTSEPDNAVIQGQSGMFAL
jgi:uncharacterized protein (DUF488 family)